MSHSHGAPSASAWVTSPTALTELASLFLRLGMTAFGGPAAHIAMMEEEVVRRRGWLSREQFLDLLGATNLIPGPNSTELAIHIGHQRAGWAGLLYGVKPVIIAVIVQALWGLGRIAVKTKFLAAVTLIAAVGSFLGVNEL